MVRKRGISPKLDLVFKKIFGDKKNSDILSDFLSAVLGVTNIESIEILDNEMISDVFVEKFSRLDLRINLNGNTSINVEIQVKNYENYKDRTLFYWSKLYTQGFKEGYGGEPCFFVLRDFSQFGTGNLPKLRPISIRIANDLRPLVFMPFERLHGCLLHSRPALRPVAACAGIRIFIALAPLRSTIVIVGFLPACHKPSPGIVDTGGFYSGFP